MSVSNFSISKALRESSRDVCMDKDKAHAVLSAVLSGAGLSTAVLFVPSPSVILPKAISIKIAASASALGASAVIGMMTFSSLAPSFRNVNIPDTYTNQNIEIVADIDHSSLLDSVYCVSPDGATINATRSSDGSYIVYIPVNGTYTLFAKANNGKTSSFDFTVDCIDKDGPVLGNYQTTADSIMIHFSDSLGSVDFTSIYGKASDGSRIEPLSVDPSSGTATFSLLDENFTVYVSDMLGNESTNLVSIN